jgi:hypothetical protein
MGFLEMIVAVVAMKTIADLVKTVTKRKDRRADEKLVAEVESLRAEVRELRRQHHETVLSFDGTLDRLDRRLDRVELRPEHSGELNGGMMNGADNLPLRETVGSARLPR